MQVKDYYKTLDVSPVASMLQIKKSFRQLAHKYHPDKNPDNALAAAHFQEVQEAYETLADPARREEYNYKRWYSRTLKKEFNTAPLTPADILQACRQLLKYLQSMNAMRIDFDGLSAHIRQLLNERNISLLRQYQDAAINAQIVSALISAAELLPHRYTMPIATGLMQIADTAPVQTEIARFIQLQQNKDRWQRYKAFVVLIVTAILCWLIYKISQ